MPVFVDLFFYLFRFCFCLFFLFFCCWFFFFGGGGGGGHNVKMKDEMSA